ncbi:hypothetical protein CspeluHIS016_0406270 [Cutaneotrichosporon spelunceum]|uniref:Uncharacterized protein n=1 Tax=Cutaneotrichosporon spelunceum TaxID=1672016 RepID=A0AAD3TVR4_9TREE|nr:hypothetical protein CspeluHIS016_0406270 [Cutaneotrichosporon spelunceum]
MMDPLLLLLLIPALFLAGTATHHLLPPYKLKSEHLQRAVRKLFRRDISRSAFGLPPLPSRLTVCAATFLYLCAAAATSLTTGTLYLALVLAQYPSSSGSLTVPLHLTTATAALLASTSTLPITATALAAAGVFLRLSNEPGTVRRILGSGNGRNLTHTAVARATLAATLLTGALVGGCAAIPRYAAFVILGLGGGVAVIAIGVGVAAWRGRRVDLGDKFEAAASCDGSVIGVLNASPFEPLPPHNFSTITKLSVPQSAGNSEVISTVAGLGGARTLTLVEHGAHVAVHDLSSTNVSSMEHTSTTNLTTAEHNSTSNLTSHAMPSTVDVSPPRTTSSPWWPNEMGDMNDTEWQAVEPPPLSEGWRRTDSMCGLLGIGGLVLCFGLTVPLLVLGVHTATLTTFTVAIALPGPALAAATFFTRHMPTTTRMPLPSAAGVASTAIGLEWDRDSGYRTIDFTRIDYGQLRWSAPQSGRYGSGPSARTSEPRNLTPVSPFTPIVLNQPEHLAMVIPKACTPKARKYSFRRRQLLKPNPQIAPAPKIRDKLGRLRGGVMSICAEHVRDGSMSGDEAAFVSMEKAEIRSAVRLTTRCPSFVDLSAPQRLMFRESIQAAIVERLTRRDADASYRVESYCDASSSPGRRGEIMRILRAELEIDEAQPRISSSSFDPARASTPLGYRPKGSTTTNIDLDLSVDWDEMGLPPNPPLPASYCGLAFAPHSISHAPSTKLDGEEMARESHEADASIVRSAGWIHALMEGWTPLKAGQSGKSTLPSIDEHLSRPRSWSPSSMQTPSSIGRIPIQSAARPISYLPSLPMVAPPEPLPAVLTRPISSPVGTSPLSPWTAGVYSHTTPRRVDPVLTPAPQWAEITCPEPATYTYRVRSTPHRAEVTKAFGAIATVSRAESCTPDTTRSTLHQSCTPDTTRSALRSLALVERAKHRDSLKDSVGGASASASRLSATEPSSCTDSHADTSGWTEGSSRFADADDSEASPPSPAKPTTTATFARHLVSSKGVTLPECVSAALDTRHEKALPVTRAYSPLTSGPYEATLASLREYSFPTSSQLGSDRPVGGAILRARGSRGVTVVFSQSANESSRSDCTKNLSGMVSSKTSTEALADRTNCSDYDSSKTSAMSKLSVNVSRSSVNVSKSSVPRGKENGSGVRTGRGRTVRGPEGMRALAPRI